GERHIIERPRLLKLLDETDARIILLVAPAGYGKTTLARQWARQRRHIWIDAGGTVPDPASLALALADELSALNPEAPNVTRQRLRARGAPDADSNVLAELLMRQFPASAPPAIIFDDLQSVTNDAGCRALLDLVIRNSPSRYVVSSRIRPDGFLAREVVEGSCLVLDHRDLAFTQAETYALVPEDDRDRIDELVALSHGWPAVIGVAARHSIPFPQRKRAEEHLYEYFVGELLLSLSIPIQHALERLAVAEIPPQGLIEAEVASTPDLVQAAVAAAILHRTDRGDYAFHPLARRFLLKRFSQRSRSQMVDAASAAAEAFTSTRRWDAAFAVVSEFELFDEAQSLLRQSLDDLLAAGRARTLRRWLEAEVFGGQTAVSDIARAEIALRDGEFARAAALSARAAAQLERDPMLFRATFVAGQAAHLREDSDTAVRLFSSAREIAQAMDQRRRALGGLFNAALDAEARELAASVAVELDAAQVESPDDAVRARIARILYGNRLGSHDVDDRFVSETISLLDDVADPMLRTNALNTLAHWNVLTGRYNQAIALADRELEDASEFRLSFVIPHGFNILAAAEAGKGQFGTAITHLEAARSTAAEDAHVMLNAANLEIRILVASLRTEAAVAVPIPEAPDASPSIRAELLSARALALVCAGETSGGARLGAEALEMSVTSEPRVTGRAVLAIKTLADGASPTIAVDALEAAVFETDNIDCLITAVRGYAALAGALRDPGVRRRVADALRSSKFRADRHLVRRLLTSDRDSTLTRREIEVLNLVAEGASNTEIAQRLFISEATVKAHLQHIFDKLGVRTRTQAAIRYKDTP
ncbi:MAG: LuxR C-terminal-related transcriptional regulator, partial [Pseudomonadota bacterium]